MVLSHINLDGIGDGRLSLLAGCGTQAVDVFFVLSGFVIAYVTTTREKDIGSYAVSRAARIFSVAIPALILTAAADYIGMAADPSVYTVSFQSWTWGLVIRSVLFLGEIWNAHRFPGSNGPYWSINFEVWYYIAYAAFLFAPRKLRWIATGLVLLMIGPKITLMFLPWLMGVACYKFCARTTLSRKTGWVLMIAPLVLLIIYETLPKSPLQAFMPFSFTPERLLSTAQDYFLALLFSFHLIGFITVSSTFAPLLERYARLIRWLAGATFSLYLAHMPIMHLVSALSPFEKSSSANLALLLTVTPLLCLGFAELSERRKKFWRGLIVKIMHPLFRLSAIDREPL